jgi:hypothetical protein
VWSQAAKELFYLGADDRIMVVSYTSEGTVRRRPAACLVSHPIRRDGVRQNRYLPDGNAPSSFHVAPGQAEGTCTPRSC